jgi:hypothetical protein
MATGWNDADATDRPPPRIISVPPLGAFGMSRGFSGVMGAILLLLGSITICLGFLVGVAMALVGAGVLVGAVVLTFWGAANRKRHAERRQAYVASVRERGEDPLIGALVEKWQVGRRTVSDDDINAALASVLNIEPQRARIICLGKIEVPEVGDAFFEPEIISPTRYFGRQLFLIPLAAILLGLWLLQVAGVLPWPRIPLGGFSYFLAMGASIGVAWVWRTAIRPTYVRMAPGVIQVLEYRFRRAKPIVRSYWMDAATVAIMRNLRAGKKPQLTLTLQRGQQKDKIDLWRMRKGEEAIQRIWQALLSTAPTPPLSDEELVG